MIHDHHQLERLNSQHRWLEERLREETLRPRPDPAVICDLERRRLLIRGPLLLAQAGLAPALPDAARA